MTSKPQYAIFIKDCTYEEGKIIQAAIKKAGLNVKNRWGLKSEKEGHDLINKLCPELAVKLNVNEYFDL